MAGHSIIDGYDSAIYSIEETKSALKAALEESDPSGSVLLQIITHGDYNGCIYLLGKDGKRKPVPLPSIIKELIVGLSDDQKQRLTIDVFACHSGKNVRPTKKISEDPTPEDQTPEDLTTYEKELRDALGCTKMLIINSGKYLTSVAQAVKTIEESQGKTIAEILTSRMFKPQTLKLAVHDSENTAFYKFGGVKLKNIFAKFNKPNELTKDQIIGFIKEELAERLKQMQEFLELETVNKGQLQDLLEESFEDYIIRYLNEALMVEISKVEKADSILITQQRIENIKMLLLAGANVNHEGRYGSTPLYIAAQEGHIEVAKALIKAGADVNKAITDGTTPLFIALQKGHKEVIKALKEASRKSTIQLADGVVYEGRAVDGKPHGQGIIKFSSGEVHKGEFRDGEIKHGIIIKEGVETAIVDFSSKSLNGLNFKNYIDKSGFSGPNLSGVDLRGADFTDSFFFFENAIVDKRTTIIDRDAILTLVKNVPAAKHHTITKHPLFKLFLEQYKCALTDGLVKSEEQTTVAPASREELSSAPPKSLILLRVGHDKNKTYSVVEQKDDAVKLGSKVWSIIGTDQILASSRS